MRFDGTANKLFRTVGKPPFIYGTAWKKESTTALVTQALAAGFRVIDTAAQPRHYREDLVGKALRRSYKAGVVKREDVFVSPDLSVLLSRFWMHNPASVCDTNRFLAVGLFACSERRWIDAWLYARQTARD
jgi:predicted aldo/keto reductase-like oxidoreductase